MPNDKVEEEDEEPISEYIRELIKKWEQDGKLLKDLATQAGLAKSMPSQIKARTSNATLHSARKLAKPLGFRDLPSLVLAGWEWFYETRHTLHSDDPEPARAEAIRLAKRFGVTDEQIRRVLVRWPLPDYNGRDELWWLSRFHEERTERPAPAEDAPSKRSGTRPAVAVEPRARRR